MSFPAQESIRSKEADALPASEACLESVELVLLFAFRVSGFRGLGFGGLGVLGV